MGTALAIVLSRSRKPHEISLWVHNAERCESIRRERENKTYLPGLKLPESVRVHGELEATLPERRSLSAPCPPHMPARLTLWHFLRRLRREFRKHQQGLEPSTHLRMSEVIAQVVTPKFAPRIAVISGPSFALEQLAANLLQSFWHRGMPLLPPSYRKSLPARTFASIPTTTFWAWSWLAR